MQMEIKIPEVGESIQEAVIAQWYGKDGERVKKGAVLFVIETDKVTLEVTAEADGVLNISVPEGETVEIGAVVGTIETDSAAKIDEKRSPKKEAAPVPTSATERSPEQPPAPEAPAAETPVRKEDAAVESTAEPAILSPSVRRLVARRQIDLSRITGTGPGGRITKGDVLLHLEAESKPTELAPRPVSETTQKSKGEKEVELTSEQPAAVSKERSVRRERMSRIRLRIAERLLHARQSTAMLTTFNEIDMSEVQVARKLYKEAFRGKHGVSLGFMSFFIKATVMALKEIPAVNASIDGEEIVYHDYVHMGIAIGAEKGLVVPVIRDVDRLSFAELERSIVEYVKKVKDNHLELSDLEGGTFTISNGGVYGSLLSTPILNPPQSGILGMHKVEDRPVVVQGQMEIRPMMYVALSYDHRIIDGREAVTFLKRIKEYVEKPERILLEI